MLAGFEYRKLDVEGVTINCAVKGAGPPLLLLHGYPQNHLMWLPAGHFLPAETPDLVIAALRDFLDQPVKAQRLTSGSLT